MIYQAQRNDLSAVIHLALQLWPDNDTAEFEEEFSHLLSNPNAAVFLARDGENAVGFAQCQLRHDFVEGTESSPVGYLEGIFVSEPYRRQGYARLLLTACEVWSKTKGCREFASDCELTNEESLHFHLNVGFTEANRIICFTKPL